MAGNQRQKILYLITKSNWGGAQRYVFDLAINVPKDQFDVVVAAGGNGELLERLRQAGIQTIPIQNLGRDIDVVSELKIFFTLYKILKEEQPDILHLNSSKIGGIGALAGRLAGIPKIIFTAHGWPFREERPWWQRLMIKFLSWLTIILSHKVIAVSRADFDEFRNRKIYFIHNGIDEIDFVDPMAAREKLGYKQSDLVVGTIAERTKNKGLEYLERAGEILKLKPLVISNLPDAAKFLHAFDVFVLPSVKEGLPYVILEAGLAGLPVVATCVGGVPEIIDDGESGLLVEPKNPAALAEKIKFLLGNPSERQQLGQNLRKKVLAEFSTSSMVTQTISLYNE